MSGKQEDFPLASLRHVENKISKLRLLVIQTASDIARSELNPEESSLTVTTAHVDRAFVVLFREIASNPAGVVEHPGF
jgi:hypothetical protein